MIFSRKIRLSFTIGLLFSFQNHHAQNSATTDYRVYQQTHQPLSCQIMDSVLFEKSLKELLAIDPNQFNENLDIYHRDLAQAYASFWIYSKRTEDLQNAILELQKIKELLWLDLFNLASFCVKLKDCEQGLNYLNRYLAETPKEYWMPQLDIWSLQNGCMQLASNDYKLFKQTQPEWNSPQQDSLSTINYLIQLQLLDTTYFTMHMDAYYHDLGLAYLQCFPYFENTILLQKSNVAYLKQKEISKADLWNVIMNYYKLIECDQASFFLKKHRQMFPQKLEKEQKQQLATAKKVCDC